VPGLFSLAFGRLGFGFGIFGGWAYAGYAFAKLMQPGVVAAGGLWGASKLLKFYFLAEVKN
jgi:hypothetical protein